jgi:hypothetical protein
MYRESRAVAQLEVTHQFDSLGDPDRSLHQRIKLAQSVAGHSGAYLDTTGGQRAASANLGIGSASSGEKTNAQEFNGGDRGGPGHGDCLCSHRTSPPACR